MSKIERLAWDTETTERTDEDRRRIARYVADLLEPAFGARLVVGVDPECEADIISARIVQVGSPDGLVWLGQMMGNWVGDSTSYAYSIVLFSFLEGQRVSPGRSRNDGLRSISVMWREGSPRVWESGAFDVYGEWSSVAHPADLIELSGSCEEIRAALTEIGLRR